MSLPSNCYDLQLEVIEFLESESTTIVTLTLTPTRLLEICTDRLPICLLVARMSALTTAEGYIATAHAQLTHYIPLDNTDKTTLILGALLLHASSELGG